MLKAHRKDEDSTPVEIGAALVDFRGDMATLVRLDRANDAGHDGKVTVKWPDGSPGYYYAGVFNLIVTDDGICQCRCNEGRHCGGCGHAGCGYTRDEQ